MTALVGPAEERSKMEIALRQRFVDPAARGVATRPTKPARPAVMSPIPVVTSFARAERRLSRGSVTTLPSGGQLMIVHGSRGSRGSAAGSQQSYTEEMS